MNKLQNEQLDKDCCTEPLDELKSIIKLPNIDYQLLNTNEGIQMAFCDDIYTSSELQNNPQDLIQKNTSSQDIQNDISTKTKEKSIPISKCQRKLIKGMIIALRGQSKNLADICNIIGELGYDITRTSISRVLKKFESSHNLFGGNSVCGRDRILKHDDVKDLIQKIYHGDVSLKEAALHAKVSRHTLSRYLADFGLGVTQYNSKRKISMEVNYEKIDIKNDNDHILRDASGQVELYVRIMFPKIQFGQVHQWERFYYKFYQEVNIFGFQWLGFYKGNKMNGRGCFIIIKCVLQHPQVFDNINELENYMRKFIPEIYFSSNVMPTNKLRIYTNFQEVQQVIDSEQDFRTFDTIQTRTRSRKCKPYTQQENEFMRSLKKSQSIYKNDIQQNTQDKSTEINTQQESCQQEDKEQSFYLSSP